jgi:hypothetical protein
MTPLCTDCAHSWRNSDGILMCGRPTTAPGPRYCYAERFGPPQADREICGPRAQYFKAKT